MTAPAEPKAEPNKVEETKAENLKNCVKQSSESVEMPKTEKAAPVVASEAKENVAPKEAPVSESKNSPCEVKEVKETAVKEKTVEKPASTPTEEKPKSRRVPPGGHTSQLW